VSRQANAVEAVLREGHIATRAGESPKGETTYLILTSNEWSRYGSGRAPDPTRPPVFKGREMEITVTPIGLVRNAREENILSVSGLGAVDGTPVLDLKPVMREFLPDGPVRQPAWVRELMAHYWNEEES